MSAEILQFATISSVIVQFITGILGTYGLTLPLAGKDIILKQVLGLEMLVQGIEFIFYLSFLATPSILTLTRSRYHDWFLSTPIMLFTTALYFFYINFIENGSEITDIRAFIQTNLKPILLFIFFNFLMLLFGYLGEFGLLDKMTAFWLGTFALIASFGTIYINFAQHSVKTQRLFTIMFVIWSLYGIAFLLNPIYKNIGYTILDLFAKNFFGLFLTYIISQKSESSHNKINELGQIESLIYHSS